MKIIWREEDSFSRRDRLLKIVGFNSKRNNKIIRLALTTKYVLKREKLMLFFVKQLYLEYLKFDFE